MVGQCRCICGRSVEANLTNGEEGKKYKSTRVWNLRRKRDFGGVLRAQAEWCCIFEGTEEVSLRAVKSYLFAIIVVFLKLYSERP
jgi:hypothetical protein